VERNASSSACSKKPLALASGAVTGHETSDVQGRSFESKYDAIYYVMQSFQNNHPRITGYVLPGRGKIDFRGFTNNRPRGIQARG
jgi:hypothetical protein